MSLIPHSILPRRMLNLDDWMQPLSMQGSLMGPTSLDMFDPFDELDTLMGKNIDWLHKPDFLPLQPIVQQKYRITVDCPGFQPVKDNIKTEINGNVLTVSGHVEDKDASGDFSVRQFKKTYDLPEGALTDRMVSFMPVAGSLIIEIPLKEKKMHLNEDLFPKLTNDGKSMSLSFGVPDNIDMDKVHVSIKDRDLIIRADDTKKSKDSTSKMHYYKRTTLPPNTDFDKLKVSFDKHKLTCSAPVTTQMRSIKNVPIERAIKPQ